MKSLPAMDLHLHSSVSDGTDTPEELTEKVREAGLALFSLTDHDAIRGCEEVQARLGPGDAAFLPGVEFSCRDGEGQYHILGYGYDPAAPAIRGAVAEGHALRMEKLRTRLDFLEREFGFTFSREDRAGLFALPNPGKPHLGNLLVKYGYAPSKEKAIDDYVERCRTGSVYLLPEKAIGAILASGGIPVLAHPAFGRGDERIRGEAMDRRLRRLTDFGLRGVEAFYSGFPAAITAELLAFAEKYGLFVTAGSDYHGKNRAVGLGDTGLGAEAPAGLLRFLAAAGLEV